MYYLSFRGPSFSKLWDEYVKLKALIRRNTINRIALQSMNFEEVHYLDFDRGHQKQDGTWLPIKDYDYLYKLACQKAIDKINIQGGCEWLLGLGMVIFCIILRFLL